MNALMRACVCVCLCACCAFVCVCMCVALSDGYLYLSSSGFMSQTLSNQSAPDGYVFSADQRREKLDFPSCFECFHAFSLVNVGMYLLDVTLKC